VNTYRGSSIHLSIHCIFHLLRLLNGFYCNLVLGIYSKNCSVNLIWVHISLINHYFTLLLKLNFTDILTNGSLYRNLVNDIKYKLY